MDWLSFWDSAKTESWGGGERMHRYKCVCVCAYVCAKCEILACLLQRVTCRLHPVQNFAEDARSAAFAVAVHGDEGKGKRERAVLVISWSCLGVRSSDVLHYKFPYVAARFE